MSTRLSTLILLLVLLHLVLSACAPSVREESSPAVADQAKKAGPANPASTEIPHDTVPVPANKPAAEWLPAQVSLTCSLNACPVQVGALMFVTSVTGTRSQVYRCTAFLIDSDKIMTSGHCDFSDSTEGYFFTRTDAPERTVRRIACRLFKVFTPGAKDDESSGRPDAAVFQLESPITNIQPLRLVSGATPAYTALTAVLVNAVSGADALTLSVGQQRCKVQRNERFFPYDLSENPDVLTLFECSGEKGNSGSPMFANGSLEVEAIVQGGGSPEAYAKRLLAYLHREPLPYEKHANITATNVRCLSYPVKAGVTCAQVSDEDMRNRFAKLTVAAIERTASKAPPGGPYQMQFKPMAFDLRDRDASELMYMPLCRTVETVTSFAIPSEHIRLVYDEWGKPSVSSPASAVSTGSILRQDTSHIQVTMNWAQPFGEFAAEVRDLRAQLGSTFSIALPLCTR